jgi:outer membrane protein
MFLRMKKIVLVLIAAVLITVTGNAQTKFGVVGVDEVFGAMPDVYKADSALVALQAELNKMYQDEETELNTAIEKFYKDSLTMNASLKDIKRKELQERVLAHTKKQEQFNKMLSDEKEKALKPLKAKLMKIIQDVAKENGYTHVAYKEQLIVFPQADDITEKVKKKLGIK